MRLSKLKLDYKNVIISKQEYIREMHKIHKCLFEYSQFIKDTDICTIEITDDCVQMTTRATEVKMLCDKIDERIAPIEILNFDFYEGTDFDIDEGLKRTISWFRNNLNLYDKNY